MYGSSVVGVATDGRHYSAQHETHVAMVRATSP